MSSEDDLNALTVKELKQQLEDRGLATKGVKAELVQRLVEDNEAKAAGKQNGSASGDTAMAPSVSVSADKPAESAAAAEPAPVSDAPAPAAAEAAPPAQTATASTDSKDGDKKDVKTEEKRKSYVCCPVDCTSALRGLTSSFGACLCFVTGDRVRAHRGMSHLHVCCLFS